MLRDLAFYPVLLMGLSAFTFVAPQQNGIFALVQILIPHLYILALLLLPLTVADRAGPLRIAMGLAFLVAAVTFGGEWISIPPEPNGGQAIVVATWNLESKSPTDSGFAAVVAGLSADVVALQELTPDMAEAFEADARIRDRFRHRVLNPGLGVTGMGLLSRFAVTDSEERTNPLGLEATLDLGDGQLMTVINAHPLPGRIETATPLRIPVGFEPASRDAALNRLALRVDQARESGHPIVLLGDLNVAPTEPAYDDIAAGLIDVHAQVGMGPGWTWRPSPLRWIPTGLLRIDYVLLADGLEPAAIWTDCAYPGDHCVLVATIMLSPDAHLAAQPPD